MGLNVCREHHFGRKRITDEAPTYIVVVFGCAAQSVFQQSELHSYFDGVLDTSESDCRSGEDTVESR